MSEGGVQGGTGKPQCSEGEGAAHVRVSERVGGGGGARRNWKTGRCRG